MKISRTLLGYLCAVVGALTATGIGVLMVPRFDLVNVAMVYLLAVVLVALTFNRAASILSALLCVLAFDLVFVPPRGRLTVDDTQYLLTFAIMVVVALIISGLMERDRREEQARTRLLVETETERLRSTLLASISHDLRTPLTVMAGASSALVEGSETLAEEERLALARSIHEQARTMSEQVTKVLQMTRLETGAITVERDWASLREIAGAVLMRLAERLAAHRLLVNLPEDLPLIRVDAGLIDQVLSNLLENAARHTPPGTVVRLRAEREVGEIVVSVEDFGPGIDPRDMHRLFAKFQRGAGEGASGSVGLGLAIARAIINLHGGRTWAEAMPGSGTAFRFALPISDVPAPPAPE